MITKKTSDDYHRQSHNVRRYFNKVFNGFAKSGKGTMGWCHGFKLHLLCNDTGGIITFCLTPPIHNFIMNLCSALAAYSFFENKPETLPAHIEKSRLLEFV